MALRANTLSTTEKKRVLSFIEFADKTRKRVCKEDGLDDDDALLDVPVVIELEGVMAILHKLLCMAEERDGKE